MCAMSFNINDWDDYAQCYDALTTLHPYRDMYRDVIACIKHAQPDTILDASCGTGNLSVYCDQVTFAENLHITGIDFSPAMLSIAQSKKTRAQTTFCEGDLTETLPFADASFAMVVSVNTLYAIRNPMHVLKEFHRVLKPGGHFVLVTPLANSHPGLILRKHARSIEHPFAEKNSAFWTKQRTPNEVTELVHAVVQDTVIAQRICTIAYYDAQLRTLNTQHILTQKSLETMLSSCELTCRNSRPTYASQNILFTSER